MCAVYDTIISNNEIKYLDDMINKRITDKSNYAISDYFESSIDAITHLNNRIISTTSYHEICGYLDMFKGLVERHNEDTLYMVALLKVSVSFINNLLTKFPKLYKYNFDIIIIYNALLDVMYDIAGYTKSMTTDNKILIEILNLYNLNIISLNDKLEDSNIESSITAYTRFRNLLITLRDDINKYMKGRDLC